MKCQVSGTSAIRIQEKGCSVRAGGFGEGLREKLALN